MFCYQCQETAKGTGCTISGVCGKTEKVANLQDLLMFVLRGISIYSTRARELSIENDTVNKFVFDGMFMTITNANFDQDRFVVKIREGLKLREEIRKQFLSAGGKLPSTLHDSATWTGDSVEEFEKKNVSVGVLSTQNEDIRSLRELSIYGLKGMAA